MAYARRWRLTAPVAGLLSTSACASLPPPASPPPIASSANQAPAVAGWENGRIGVFVSLRFDVTVELPDGKHWRINDRNGPWLLATHAPSSSILRLRLLRTDRAVNRDTCEQRIRTLDPALPRPEPGSIVNDQTTPVVPGWDTHAVTWVQKRTASEISKYMEGHTVVFGADVRRCWALHYVTSVNSVTSATSQAEGDVEGIVGARLGDVDKKIVGTLRFDHDLSTLPRAPRSILKNP